MAEAEEHVERTPMPHAKTTTPDDLGLSGLSEAERQKILSVMKMAEEEELVAKRSDEPMHVPVAVAPVVKGKYFDR